MHACTIFAALAFRIEDDIERIRRLLVQRAEAEKRLKTQDEQG